MLSTRFASIAGVLFILLSLTGKVTGAEADDAQPQVITDESRLVLSDRLAVYQHYGDPLSLTDVRELDQQGEFAAPRAGSSLATNFGLTRAETWLRLHFSTAESVSGRRLLEIGHASLDIVDLYFAPRGQNFTLHQGGDLLPFNAREVPHRHHVFALELQPQTDYSLYLRVASEGTVTVPVTLWQPDALWQHDQMAYSLLSMYYGLLIALLVYNFFLYVSLRDPLYILYVAFIGLLAVGQGGLSGFSAQFLWPDNALMTNLSTAVVAVAGVFGALFVQRFLSETARSMRMYWFMPVISVGYGLTFFSAVAGAYFLASLMINAISLVFPFGALAMGLKSWQRGQPGARFFAMAWAALLVGIVVIALHNLGLLPSNGYTLNALLIGSAVEMLLLSLALADRIQEIHRSRDLAQAQTISLKQKMLEAVHENERQLELRVAERTCELEGANQQLRESQQLLEHHANHDALTGLANRKLLAELLAGAAARARRQSSAFALLMADLDRFKSINDDYGHIAGDKVLVEMAQRLSAHVRDSDTVARIGGDEFVILLESIEALENAELVRSKITQAMARPVVMENGDEVMLGISIGIALYPEHSGDIEALFRVADRDMYSRKRDVTSLTAGFEDTPP